MRLELETSDTTRENVFFTVSPWGLEGSPRTIAKRDLLEMLPKEIRDKTQFVDQKAQVDALSDEGEFWRGLVFAVLAGLVLESLLAWRFGRR